MVLNVKSSSYVYIYISMYREKVREGGRRENGSRMDKDERRWWDGGESGAIVDMTRRVMRMYRSRVRAWWCGVVRVEDRLVESPWRATIDTASKY